MKLELLEDMLVIKICNKRKINEFKNNIYKNYNVFFIVFQKTS